MRLRLVAVSLFVVLFMTAHYELSLSKDVDGNDPNVRFILSLQMIEDGSVFKPLFLASGIFDDELNSEYAPMLDTIKALAYSIRGSFYAENNSVSRALMDYVVGSRFFQEDPESLFMFDNFATTLFQKADYETAISLYEFLGEKDYSTEGFVSNLVFFHYLNQDFDEALELAESALESDPDDVALNQNYVLLMIYSGETEKAVDVLLEIEEYLADDDDSIEDLSLLYLLDYYSENDEFPDIVSILGEANDLYDSGDYHQAAVRYMAYLFFEPTDADNIYNLALCLDKMDFAYDAVVFYNRYLSMADSLDVLVQTEDAVNRIAAQTLEQGLSAEEDNFQNVEIDPEMCGQIYVNSMQSDFAEYSRVVQEGLIQARNCFLAVNNGWESADSVSVLSKLTMITLSTGDLYLAGVFADALAEAAYEMEDDAMRVEVLINRGMVLKKKLDLGGALVHYEEAKNILLEQSDEGSIDLGIIYDNIANILDELKYYDEALENRLEAVDIFERLDEGGEHLATGYGNLATTYMNAGDLENALAYYNRSRDILEDIYGESSPAIAMMYDNMGVLYRMQGDYDRAMEYHQKSHSIIKKFYGDDHFEMAINLRNMGDTYRVAGDVEEAIEQYLEAEKIAVSIYEECNSFVAETYAMLSDMYSDIGDSENQVLYHKKLLDMESECGF